MDQAKLDRDKLDAYLRVGKKLFDGELIEGKNKKGETIYETLDQREGYKIELIKHLEKVRVAVVNDHDDWDTLLMDAVSHPRNNITEKGQHANFRRVLAGWSESRRNKDDLLEALKEMWTSGKSPSERVQAFLDRAPKHEYFMQPAQKLTPISYLLMALGRDYPPFQSDNLKSAYEWFGYPKHPKNLGERYEHELNFLDQLVQHSDGRPKDLLDAQSLVWTLGGHPEKVVIVKNGHNSDSNPLTERLDALDEELFLRPARPASFLSETVWPLLKDKKQIIFQGPPGTGKTYVARELAKCLAGSEDRVELVQFHPSYAYEDFVQGFRPMPKGDSAAFELRDGPLIRLAQKARAEADRVRDTNEDPAKFFLIIDEINRGNLAKVFGELYFLLEYRGPKNEMRLQYSNESDAKFWMPENLYIIGTMNTADRSIALVDAALRRRFYFVPFHPNEEPIKGLLKEWLEREAKKREAEERKWSDKMGWLPGVVDAANKKLSEKLGNEETAIGPSYFMKGDIPEKMERVWKYNVLPYIEEQLYGSNLKIEDFALDKLKRAPAGQPETGAGEAGNTNADEPAPQPSPAPTEPDAANED